MHGEVAGDTTLLTSGLRRVRSPGCVPNNDKGVMKSYRKFVAESYVSDKPISTGNISGADLVKQIGKMKSKSIFKHPYHQAYVAHANTVAYRYHRNEHGFEHVYAATDSVLQHKDGSTTRRMVKYDISPIRRNVTNAHLFHNKNDERHSADFGGGRVWEHIKSHKE